MVAHHSPITPRAMERRRAPRQRTFLAGRLAYGDPAVTISCGIRNLSPAGARIALESPVLLTLSVRLLVPRDGVAHDATVIWRRGAQVGLALTGAHDLRDSVDEQIRTLQAIWKEMALR